MSSCVCLVIYDIPLYLSPVCSVWFRLVYSLLPRCFCESALPCLALMSSLKTIIWVYSSSPCSSFLPAVTEDHDRRPDQNSKRRPFTPFFFPFFKSLLFCPSWHGSHHSSSRSSPRMMRGSSAGSSRVRWPRALDLIELIMWRERTFQPENFIQIINLQLRFFLKLENCLQTLCTVPYDLLQPLNKWLYLSIHCVIMLMLWTLY